MYENIVQKDMNKFNDDFIRSFWHCLTFNFYLLQQKQQLDFNTT